MAKNKTFVAMPEDDHTLEQTIDAIHNQTCKTGWMWRCVEECYTRTYGANLSCRTNVTRNYQVALERLMNYDIIVITEKLKYPDYVRGLEAMLGDLGNRTLSGTEYAWCAEESAYWNRKFPANISKSTVQHLEEMNAHDTQLYKALTNCGVDGVVFPTETLLHGFVSRQ
jgi:hypothetical protein